jgi:hypothetical protein
MVCNIKFHFDQFTFPGAACNHLKNGAPLAHLEAGQYKSSRVVTDRIGRPDRTETGLYLTNLDWGAGTPPFDQKKKIEKNKNKNTRGLCTSGRWPV